MSLKKFSSTTFRSTTKEITCKTILSVNSRRFLRRFKRPWHCVNYCGEFCRSRKRLFFDEPYGDKGEKPSHSANNSGLDDYQSTWTAIGTMGSSTISEDMAAKSSRCWWCQSEKQGSQKTKPKSRNNMELFIMCCLWYNYAIGLEGLGTTTDTGSHVLFIRSVVAFCTILSVFLLVVFYLLLIYLSTFVFVWCLTYFLWFDW